MRDLEKTKSSAYAPLQPSVNAKPEIEDLIQNEPAAIKQTTIAAQTTKKPSSKSSS
jgi:hypothetical protein